MKSEAEPDPRDDSDLDDDSELEDEHSATQDAEWDLEDIELMTAQQSFASDTLPNESVNTFANEVPICSGGFSAGNNTSYENVQFSDYLNQVEYFPLPTYPAGMPRVNPVSLFGEMVSDVPVLFDSANQGVQDADLPRPIAPLDYNPGGRHPIIPYTIIPPEQMYQNRPYLPLLDPQVSAPAQRLVKREDGQQPRQLSQVPMFEGRRQAPLFQGRGFQISPREPGLTNAERYQEDYFWAQEQVELKRNQELYNEGHLYQKPRFQLPNFDVEPPVLDSDPPPFKELVFTAAREMCQERRAEADLVQPSTPKPRKQQPAYGTPDNETQNAPKTYPPKQAMAHREDKRRRKSDFVFKKYASFDIKKDVAQLASSLKETAENVKLNPGTTVSKPFSAKSVEEIGAFHYSLRDSTVAARRRSDPVNLDSVRWERSMGGSTMDKQSSPDAKPHDTPSPGQDDSSSGQDSPTPKRKKVRVELQTLKRKVPATTRNTSKKTPVSERTASKKAKCNNPSVDRARLQTPPIRKIRTRQSLPNSWAEASASDILMFELRKQGADFPAITETLRATCDLNYLSRTLRNRYWKIETSIGKMPDNLQPMTKDDVKDEKEDVPEEADEDTSGLSTPKPNQEENTWYF
ncbi:uncharacterized protein N7503_008079 [Penicillium pulvis]|uniref:uncharacterized protein n=1 Tax=Penicillium pulvis TaxID=1562058 RepID=UPI002546E2CB|nr:uncharacterized protein N7503_008079 [Penicillium pulvis]KAJ5792101.1 hypothetical protein N7503_008079 [Penicillium pulvis]